MVEEAWNWCGRIDGLVNNAGISQRSLAVETDFSVYQKIIGVDLLAPIALTQQLLPRMVGAGGGQIVRSEEHTSELQSLMRISYAVFCLKKKIETIMPSMTKHTLRTLRKHSTQ